MPSNLACGMFLGAGWLSFVFVAEAILNRGDFSLVLSAMVLGEILGRFLVLGWVPIDRSDRPLNDSGSQALGAVLVRWIILVAVIAFAAAVELANPFINQPTVGLYLAGGSLSLALAHLATAQRVALRRSGKGFFAARILFATALVWGLDQISEISHGLLLAALALLWLLLTLALMRGLPTPFGNENLERQERLRETLLAIGPALLGVVDLLILFWLLSPGLAVGYLMMRAGGMVVLAAMYPVQAATSARLAVNRSCENMEAFAADAARVNLGLLLIGGGSSVGILALQPLLPPQFGTFVGADPAMLMWILLGASSPAYFGAAPLFMSIIGLRREWALLSLAGALLMVGLAYGTRVSTPLALAQTYAAVHLVTAAVAAAIIGRKRGVWPGLTALMAGRIRLV